MVKLHEEQVICSPGDSRMAVPGGWIYRLWNPDSQRESTCFVPDPSAPHVLEAAVQQSSLAEALHRCGELGRDLRTMTAIASERGKRIDEARNALLPTHGYPCDVPSAIRSLQCLGAAESVAGSFFVTATAAELGEDVE